MKFNLDQTLKDMLAAMQGELGKDWHKVRAVMEQFLERRKLRLKTLIDGHAIGQINRTKFEDRLNTVEKMHLEAQINALRVVSKAIAQKAANAAIEVLEKAVRVSLGRIV